MSFKISYIGEQGVLSLTESRQRSEDKNICITSSAFRSPLNLQAAAHLEYAEIKSESCIRVALTPTQPLKGCHLRGILRWQTFNSQLLITSEGNKNKWEIKDRTLKVMMKLKFNMLKKAGKAEHVVTVLSIKSGGNGHVFNSFVSSM